MDEAGCDLIMKRRVREKGELPGALWHIFHPGDTNKIRDLLNKVPPTHQGFGAGLFSWSWRLFREKKLLEPEPLQKLTVPKTLFSASHLPMLSQS